MAEGKESADTASWFLPALDAVTRARVVEFLDEQTGHRFEIGRILGDRGRAGIEEVLGRTVPVLGYDTMWLTVNGSEPVKLLGVGDGDALAEWRKLVTGGFVSPCIERSHEETGPFVAEPDDFCPRCPVGPGAGQACLLCAVRDQDRWRGALGARLDSDLVGDPLRRVLFAALADDLGLALGRWEAELERQNLRQQLATSQRLEAVGRLAGGVAHDFNNALTVILASSGFIRERAAADPELLVDLDAIEQAAQSASELSRQLLAFGRRQLLEPRDVDISAQLRQTEKMLRRLLGEDIELNVHCAEEPVVVNVDPAQLEQVIVNLAINARDAMPRGGQLVLETAAVELDADYAAGHTGVTPGPYVLLAVSDDGEGMDEQTMARIFEPFFTTKEQGKGSGLGLATVYGIVKQSGGFIWVYSEPGRGTTFKIYLPRVDRPAAVLAGETPLVEGQGGDETILVVEDSEPVRLMAVRMLERAGYRVVAAANMTAALELLERGEKVDLLFTDVVMPGGSGRELADEVSRRFPGARVLFTSGYTDNAIAHYGIIEPGLQFLHKPFTSRQLLEKVRRVLDQD